MRYKKILLDIDDTLFDFVPGNRNATEALMAELGLSSPTVFEEYQVYNHACWQALERGEMDQGQLHVERFRRFLAEKGRDDDPAKVADRFAELLGQQVIPLPHSEEMLRELCRHREVILLTNGITVIQKARFNNSYLKDLPLKMVISQEVGVSKPDPRIFELALEGTDPKDALMIGDGVGSDVAGANNAGVDMCWYNPSGKTLREGLHAEYVVADLMECIPIALQ